MNSHVYTVSVTVTRYVCLSVCLSTSKNSRTTQQTITECGHAEKFMTKC